MQKNKIDTYNANEETCNITKYISDKKHEEENKKGPLQRHQSRVQRGL